MTMKTALQLVASVAALGTLLAGSVQAATDLADLPLKSSVLAKPNVIFGVDDSGSMDWEILLDTSSGGLWWNGVSAWDAAANKPLASNATYKSYRYLLPVGTAAGGQIYAHNSSNGYAVPPINQLAWVRSSAFNPLYYDSKVTYAPWAPAYFGGSLKPVYPNAAPNAASAHPAVVAAPTLNVSVDWTSANANFSSNGYTFMVQQGMTLPVGSYVASTAANATGTPCSGTTMRTLTAEQTVSGDRSCLAAIPYFPATFWQPEVCALGPNCVNAPNGVGTLKRYEIRATTASYPSGRSYADELQNFANWFTYYRKRKLMLAASMGRVFEGISGLRLGNLAFNENVAVTMYDADSVNPASNRFAAAGKYYLNAMTTNGTPTHQNVKNIAAQFETNTSIVQHACQRNSMFIVTDGFSNTTSITVPAYDKTKYGNTQPYTTTPVGSLADLALSYYTNRLRAGGTSPLPAGLVPPSNSAAPNADKNPDLHITTYAVTLGVRGSIWPNPYPKVAGNPATKDPFVDFPSWPTPVADSPSMIDDQYHATLNGRGQMYLASNPDETAAGIRAGLSDILSQIASQGGVAVSSINLVRGDGRAYVATYDPNGWVGNLQSVSVNRDTGELGGASLWDAGAQLNARDWTTRVIASWSGAGGVAFTDGNVGATVNPGGGYGVTADVMNYLRGDRSLEATTFRQRKSLIGSIVNSEPAVDRDTGVVYVATGEGMLHAFEATGASAGSELWAYVPGRNLSTIGQTVQRSYSFRARLEGTPVIGKSSATEKILVAGMGVSGRGYYAIDVTSPRGLSAPDLAAKVKWEFPAANDAATQAKVGQTTGRPLVVRNAAGQYVVLVTSGYNNTLDGKGRLWMLNASTGAIIKEFVTSDGTMAAESGLAHMTPFGEVDGSVRYVYGGDLLGNLWRIDIDAEPATGAAVTKLAQLRGPAPTSAIQPVTSAPEVMSHKGKRVVYVGTGRLLALSDFGNTAVQSFYAIADGTYLANARNSLTQRTYDPSGNGSITGAKVDWTTGNGWYLDLPGGEQANTRPSIAYGAVAFVTNKAGATDCSASSKLYVIDVLTGGQFVGSDYVSSTLSTTSNSSAVTLMLTRGTGKVVGITRRFSDGGAALRDIAANIPIPAGKNAWTEIRR
jgi:type IV pilus assembly protein PilY1